MSLLLFGTHDWVPKILMLTRQINLTKNLSVQSADLSGQGSFHNQAP